MLLVLMSLAWPSILSFRAKCGVRKRDRKRHPAEHNATEQNSQWFFHRIPSFTILFVSVYRTGNCTFASRISKISTFCQVRSTSIKILYINETGQLNGDYLLNLFS